MGSGSVAPRLGLVLGSGSARGWAHVGVIRTLEKAGFRPDLVCGTSVGALIGAAYVAGEIDRFEQWVRGLGMREVVSFMDFGLAGGMLKGERLMAFFRRHFLDRPIESLERPFGAVATALHTGAEVWLRDGSTVEAVRASIALPGLFTPVMRDGLTLVDGGLVNPVPISLARAMGAEVVIAVDLNADILGRHLRADPRGMSGGLGEWRRLLPTSLGPLWSSGAGSAEAAPRMPSMLDVLASSINIMQVRITRSRLAGEPPDVTVTPRLAHLGLLDFHRADEAIEAGEQAMTLALPALRALLETRA